jgi:hypothetical protein
MQGHHFARNGVLRPWEFVQAKSASDLCFALASQFSSDNDSLDVSNSDPGGGKSMNSWLKEMIKYPIERCLEAIESRLIARPRDLTYSPIFMIAPARSGSTVVYQAMTRYFDLCYISNSMTRFPESPSCLAYLLSPLRGCDPPESFRNSRGHVEGGKGPSDGTKIWSRWFRDDPQYIPNGVLTQRQRHEVRATVGRFQHAFGAPFINKTQRNCGRILALNEIFPEAVFVQLHRDPFEMVRSRWKILKERADENWLWQSYRPSNSSDIVTEDPIEHLCLQVAFTEAEIDRDRRAIGSSGFFDIEYGTFCDRPADTLESFAAFYESYSSRPLKKRHPIPSRFSSSHSDQLPAAELEAIRFYLGQKAHFRPRTGPSGQSMA